MSKKLAVYCKWREMIKALPPIEEMEIAGSNKHRVECFNTALHLTKRVPVTEMEFGLFMDEYIRQLVGPEFVDVYSKPESYGTNVKTMFNILRKYTLGV